MLTVVFHLGNVLLPGRPCCDLSCQLLDHWDHSKKEKTFGSPNLGHHLSYTEHWGNYTFSRPDSYSSSLLIFEITYDFSKFVLHGLGMTIRYSLMFCFLSVRQAERELLNLQHLLVILLVQPLRRFLVNLLRTPIRATTLWVCLTIVQMEHFLATGNTSPFTWKWSVACILSDTAGWVCTGIVALSELKPLVHASRRIKKVVLRDWSNWCIIYMLRVILS